MQRLGQIIFSFFLCWCWLVLVSSQHSGTPGVNYPVFAQVPHTSFSCHGRAEGYYADQEAQCQAYHMCSGEMKYSFLCPNSTLFSQVLLTCDWYNIVTCGGDTHTTQQHNTQVNTNSGVFRPSKQPAQRKIFQSLAGLHNNNGEENTRESHPSVTRQGLLQDLPRTRPVFTVPRLTQSLLEPRIQAQRPVFHAFNQIVPGQDNNNEGQENNGELKTTDQRSDKTGNTQSGLTLQQNIVRPRSSKTLRPFTFNFNKSPKEDIDIHQNDFINNGAFSNFRTAIENITGRIKKSMEDSNGETSSTQRDSDKKDKKTSKAITDNVNNANEIQADEHRRFNGLEKDHERINGKSFQGKELSEKNIDAR